MRQADGSAPFDRAGDLGRLVAATAYNTRQRAFKTTKTRVEKWLPVHPALAELLAGWKAAGWSASMDGLRSPRT